MRKFILFAALLAAPALADTQAGVEAWERGDYKIAVDQWRAAAGQGDADAMFNLGQAYKLGRGVPVDTWKAEDYYRQAAVKGHVEAADNYGLALFQNGKPRDAIPFLEKSSERADPRAEYIFGTMLFNGIDVRKDWPRAYALTSRAAAAGLPQAAQSLRQMDGFLSAQDRQRGLALAQRLAAANAPAVPAEVAGIRSVAVPPSSVAPQPTYRAAPVPAFVAPAAPRKLAAGTKSAVAPPVTGPWRVQLGAFGDPGNARRLGQQMAGRFPGRAIDYVAAGALIKVTVKGYATRGAAQAACGSVKPCVPVGP